MKRRSKAVTVATLLALALTAGLWACGKKERGAPTAAAPQKGMYTDFLKIAVHPTRQENDVLDIRTDLTMDWEKAVKALNFVERPGDDLWVGIVLTKMTFSNAKGDVVQSVDFDATSLTTLWSTAKSNDTNPQIFNRITYYKGGCSDNYGSPTTRPDDMTAEIHFPVYKELGHHKGTLKINGYLVVPPHYENKKGEPGIYIRVDGKDYDKGLIREIPIELTGEEKIPVYSRRISTTPEAFAAANVETGQLGTILETVTVIPEGGLKLRDGPSFDARTLKILPRGAKLDVYEKSGEWYKVRTPEGQLGWAKSVNEGEVLLD